jgi:hypothetical protein
MDNKHVISLIERKTSEDDLSPRVWVSYRNSQRCEPTMDNLLSWMEAGTTTRMRSGAQICKNARSHRSIHLAPRLKMVMESMEKIDSNRSNVMYVKVDTI